MDSKKMQSAHPEKQNIEEIILMAGQIHDFSKQRLLVHLRFLNLASYQLSDRLDMNCPRAAATDGESYFYDPVKLIRSYMKEKTYPARLYLHSVLHCVFRHAFVSGDINRELWDLACDIAVENIIGSMKLEFAGISSQKERIRHADRLKRKVRYLNAEKIYSYLKNACGTSATDRLKTLFAMDDHSLWYADRRSHARNNTTALSSQTDKAFQVRRDQEIISGLRQKWRTVSEHMQTEMETFMRSRTGEAGDMVLNLREVNRERYDYTEFLRKFAVMSEHMKIDEDEFDYNYYTYGLELYGDLPLVEPLEYKEEKKIRDFVIAIDTSGSVADGKVHRFITKTWNILQQSQSFFTKMNLHIIQCDAGIQEDARITSKEDLDKYLETMKIRGCGGTDFRPVFDYTDKLISSGELSDLKGLIYFTDGYGIFPGRMPPYNVVFAFAGDDADPFVQVPSWAMKLVLEDKDYE